MNVVEVYLPILNIFNFFFLSMCPKNVFLLDSNLGQYLWKGMCIQIRSKVISCFSCCAKHQQVLTMF